MHFKSLWYPYPLAQSLPMVYLSIRGSLRLSVTDLVWVPSEPTDLVFKAPPGSHSLQYTIPQQLSPLFNCHLQSVPHSENKGLSIRHNVTRNHGEPEAPQKRSRDHFHLEICHVLAKAYARAGLRKSILEEVQPIVRFITSKPAHVRKRPQ